MKIYLCAADQTAKFAAAELSRLIFEMGNSAPEIIYDCTYSPKNDGIYLGVFENFSCIIPITKEPTALDDEVYIDMNGTSGIIAGLCPRSMLIAVYRYATELGCRFLTVGKAGEKIPNIDIQTSKASVHEAPSYRHRGICIEGAVSVENVVEMIDFIPKIGMNSYFLQFRESHIFFDRWYSHTFNPILEKKGSFTVDQAREAISVAAREMSKRGILYHAVGHGWTCEPFGVPGLGWDKWTQPLPEEARDAFAMINGKRGLWENTPINTQACYSNANVRKKILENVCEYIEAHPTVDVLHFWLADGFGNHCECEGCKKHRPSDFYIMLLNELDEMLTERKLNTRIVFLIYVDLLWPPIEMTLNNPDRFIIMFAPITRSYRKSFRSDSELPPITDYVRNAGFEAMPTEVSLNVAYLKEWQKIFDGDGFDYDYHYMWAHIKDPGCVRLAKILHEDIQNLKNIGLNGFISCQLGRVMFPNALNLTVMGRTLWKRDTDFEEVCTEYFNDCYGDKGAQVLEYMKNLSEMYYYLELEGTIKKVYYSEDAPVKSAMCSKITDMIKSFMSEFSKYYDDSIFFKWLIEHASIYIDYTNVLKARFDHDKELLLKRYGELQHKIFLNEDKYQSVFDPWEFTRTGNSDFKQDPQ